MNKRKTLLITILLFLLSPLLFAEVIAYYEPAAILYMQPYQKLHNTYFPAETIPSSCNNKMSIYLGRFVVNTGDVEVQNFLLYSETDSNIYFHGPLLYGNTPSYDDIGFAPKAQLVHQGINGGFTNLWHNDGNPIQPNDTLMKGIIIIHIYLVSYADADVFLPKGSYSHVKRKGSFGTLLLNYSTIIGDIWSGSFDPVVGENGEPLPPTHVLNSGSDMPDEPVEYNDPKPIEYRFSIDEEPEGFVLNDAIGSLKAAVAEASITLYNTSGASSHQVYLSFSNAEQSSQFTLSQKLGSSTYTIPYSLVFGNEEVTAGVSIRWENLGSEERRRTIYVTGIAKSDAEAALSGKYQDTIYVNISPVDTI